MKLKTKCLPLGSIPYSSVDPAARMVAKLFPTTPYLAFMPIVDEEDSVISRTLKGIPGIKIKENKIVLKTSTKQYKHDSALLDKAYNSLDKDDIEKFAIESVFLEKYLQLIKKFRSPQACINLLGPFSLSQMLDNAVEEQMLTDKSFRKLFIQAICVKAIWMINKIKEYNPSIEPIVVLEEPLYGRLGEIKRADENVTVELITNMFARVIEKLKSVGATVVVQCMEKCDWKIPINAGADIISYDAYNNPNNLCIIPETIIDFLKRGGRINWGIVPVANESMVKALNIDYIENRLMATIDGLVLAGVSQDLVHSSAMVSVQGDMSHLPVIFAEKAIMLSTQLASRLIAKGY